MASTLVGVQDHRQGRMGLVLALSGTNLLSLKNDDGF